MQTPAPDASDDIHYVKMQSTTHVPTESSSAPQRPRLPPRAASERVRSPLPPPAPLRPSGSVRAFVRLASVQEETTTPTTTLVQDDPSIGVVSRTSLRMQSMRREIGTPMSVAPLVRAMSSLLRLNATPDQKTPPPEETFRCHICFDDVGVSEAVTLTTCGHKYCLACFKPYLQLKITEGNVCPVCFHPTENEVTNSADERDEAANNTCGVPVSEEQIKAIVDEDTFKKYEYFRFNKEHKHARDCPYCAHPQDCAGPETPACVCESCGKSFCFFHGNAHENSTCADYELKTAHEESLNRAKIDEIAKPCPGCHRDVEKNGGCNHMKCIGCNTSFCWLCGEIVEDTPTPSHYAEGECAGRQFEGMEQEPVTRRQLFITFLFTILTVPPSFVIALVLTPLVWVCNRRKTLIDVFAETMTVSIIVLCGIIGLVLAPVGWAIDLVVAILVFLVVVVVEIVKFCCCDFRWCRHARQPESDPAINTIEEPNDLETGLVETAK